MITLHRHVSRIRTLVFCVAILAACVGYLARWGHADAVTTTGVSIVAATAATGAVVNAVSLHRDR